MDYLLVSIYGAAVMVGTYQLLMGFFGEQPPKNKDDN